MRPMNMITALADFVRNVYYTCSIEENKNGTKHKRACIDCVLTWRHNSMHEFNTYMYVYNMFQVPMHTTATLFVRLLIFLLCLSRSVSERNPNEFVAVHLSVFVLIEYRFGISFIGFLSLSLVGWCTLPSVNIK